jgi:hypothetical protein
VEAALAGVVEQYKDGLGNLLAGVKWDGTPETAQTIKDWTQGRATVDRRGVLGVLEGHIRRHVGQGDYVCMDATRRIFPLTEAQMAASYTEIVVPPV